MDEHLEKKRADRRKYQSSEKYKRWRRQHRKDIQNADSKRYEKTVKGFLMRMYRNMQSRVQGIQWKKAHLYKGKKLIEREKFYDWALSSKDFKKLFKRWKKNQYDRKLTPTVDRINPKKGYELSNMEWVTHSENSRRANNTRKKI